MSNKKEELAKAIETYLIFDQVSDERLHNPSPANKSHHEKIKKDAEKLTEIAINILNK
jgi:hypothetical protein